VADVGPPPVISATAREALSRALAALEAGQVVAVPTDTVYGLAARTDRPAGMAAVFAAKDRPAGLALPVLVGRWRPVRQVAADWPKSAANLAARFWPGALTVVVPARPELGPELGGDGRTVGLRRPDLRILQRLCRGAGPLAVTSANRHGRPPCTTAEEVVQQFSANEVALVVDGGRCDGRPSTVVDCTVSPPTCIREGAVPWPWVEAAMR
jgi:L-threonylcarbamoyladenylate synthase